MHDLEMRAMRDPGAIDQLQAAAVGEASDGCECRDDEAAGAV